MANTRDTIVSQIPGHILEGYPRFREFLEAYYEWLHQDGNPYASVKYHMDYLDFQKSMDSYVEQMKNEYLHDVPDTVLLDKELFIKWSKKFNLARGSHASYKFLFKLLFNEQDTEIYLPKENILKTSDGVWVSGEHKMILTASGNIDAFTFQVIEQEREVTPGNFEYAYATVQSANFRYSGRYRVIELSVTDIDGEFDLEYPISTELGGSEWIIPTVSKAVVDTKGTNNQLGDRVEIQSLEDYKVERTADIDDQFDTRITSFYTKDEIELYVNSVSVTDFTFDGRIVTSNSINVGDTVEVRTPAQPGYISISDVDQDGGVRELSILEAPIGIYKDFTLASVGYGSGFSGTAIQGFASKVNGYYKNNKGQLSSTMYLQDSFYYQEYSYAIKTRQDISAYSDIVKQVLHPAGFQFFGNLSIIEILELIMTLEESSLDTIPKLMESRAKYTLGPNYSFFSRFKAGLDHRLYQMWHFLNKDQEWNDEWNNDRYMLGNIIDDIGDYIQYSNYRYKYLQFDMEMVNSNEMDIVEDDYVENDDEYFNETEYKLGDKSLERTFTTDSDGNQIIYSVPLKGWMTKHYFSDYHLYIPQDYSSEVESGYNYFESGYVSERV